MCPAVRLNYCYYAWPSYSLDGLRTVLFDLILDWGGVPVGQKEIINIRLTVKMRE